MERGADDPVAFRARLNVLYADVRTPTYAQLEAHAAHSGRKLATSTTGTLLTGSGIPRWDTVETFVLACRRHASTRRLRVSDTRFDLATWREYHERIKTPTKSRSATRESYGPVIEKSTAAQATQSQPTTIPSPRQLPNNTTHFTGRDNELTTLYDLLRCQQQDRDINAVVAAIVGTAGVGKTALAVHWAHQIRDQFPDGDLFANLQGFDPVGTPAKPGDVLEGFLRAMGLSGDNLPDGLAERAALYRTLVAGRRMLIVLDNARDPDQVRALLPGTPSCLTLVTSRNQLSGLVARDGVNRLNLDLLTPHEAVALLRRIVGHDIDCEPDAAHELVRRCAYLPLALRIAAERITNNPHKTLTGAIVGLSEPYNPLDTLAAGDDELASVRPVFSWSYQALQSDPARLFRLLGLHPGPKITVFAAAALGEVTPAITRRHLDTLTNAHMVTETEPGCYRIHALLRAYAIELVQQDHDADERDTAVRRLLDYYLHTAYSAYRHLTQRYMPTRFGIPGTQYGAAWIFLDQHQSVDQQCRDWYDTEQLNFIAVVSCAAHHNLIAYARHLLHTLWYLYDRYHEEPDGSTAQEAPLNVTRRLGDRAAERVVLNLLRTLYFNLDEYGNVPTILPPPPPLAPHPGPEPPIKADRQAIPVDRGVAPLSCFELPPMEPRARAQVLVSLAHNLSAPPDVLRRLLALPQAAVHVAGRADITEEFADALLGLDDVTVARALASNRRLPAAVWGLLVSYPAMEVRLDALRARFTRRHLDGKAPSHDLPVALLECLIDDPHPEMRVALAHCDGMPAEILARLAAHTDVDVRASVASSWPDAPGSVRRGLLTDPNPRVRRAAILSGNPVLPADLQSMLLAEPVTRAPVIPFVTLTSGIAAELATDPSAEVRRAVAAHPELPASWRDRLAVDPDPLVRSAVMCRRDTPEALRSHLDAQLHTPTDDGQQYERYLATVLNEIEPVPWLRAAPLAERLTYVDSPYTFFRLAVACSEGLPPYAVARLLHDPNVAVRHQAAIYASNVPGHELERLVHEQGDGSPKTGLLTDHPNFPQEAFCRFAMSDDVSIRRLALKSNDLPADLVARLAADADVHTRALAAAHPQLPAECLLNLLTDTELAVVAQAATSTTFPTRWMSQLLDDAGL